MNLGSLINMMNFVSLIASLFIMLRLWRYKKRANLSGPIVYFISEIAGNMLVLLCSLSLALETKLFFFNHLFALFVMGSCGWYIWLESFVTQRRGISPLGWVVLSLPALIFLYVNYMSLTSGVGFLVTNPAVEWHFGYPFLVFDELTMTAKSFVGINQLICIWLGIVAIRNFDRMKTIKKKYFIFSLGFTFFFFLCFGSYFYFRNNIPFISVFDVGLFAMMFVKFFILYKPYGGAAVDLNMTDRYALLDKIQQGLFVVDEKGELLDYNISGKNFMERLGFPDFHTQADFFSLMTAVFPSFNFDANYRTEKEYVIEQPGQAPQFFNLEIDTLAQSEEIAAHEEQYAIFLRDTTEAHSQQLNLLVFRAAFYATDDPMLICNPRGEIEYASCSFSRNLGYEESQIKGRHFLDFLLECGDEEVLAVIRKAMQAQQGWSGYVRGSDRVCRVTIFPIFDAAKKQAGFSAISRDVTNEYNRTELLKQEARQDFLTQIDNRRTFFTLAAGQLQSILDRQGSVAVLMLDIDFFKRVNDTYGHAGGDEVLKSFAALIKTLVRKDDLFARYGGEEFVLMVAGMEVKVVLAFAERIRARVEKMFVYHDAWTITLTTSIGVCFWPGSGAITLEDLIQRADEALYSAKKQGRNRVLLWQEPSALNLLYKNHDPSQSSA